MNSQECLSVVYKWLEGINRKIPFLLGSMKQGKNQLKFSTGTLMRKLKAKKR